MLPRSVSSKGQSIHINPNFKNSVLQKLNNSSCSNPALMTLPTTTHINPLFIKPPKKATIHMNPQFLSEKILQQQESKILPETTKTQKELQSGFPINSEPKTLQLNKIISKSRTRIIRETHSQPKASVSSPSKQLLVLTKRKLIRAPIVSSQQNSTALGNEIFKKKQRLKVINKIAPSIPLTGIVPILKRRPGAFVARYALKRSNSVKKNAFPIHVVDQKHKSHMDSTTKSVNKQLRVISINGILYKSTGNKLQRNVESTISTKPLQIVQTTNSKTSKNSVGRALYVRGAKYVMDPRGFKLTRVTQPNVSTKSTQASEPKTSSSPYKTLPRRIDIGGITYLSSSHSKNVFLRTSTHLVLAHLNQAKQRSVQLLSRSLTKTNKPCLIFQRLGKCAALERNRCSKVHDKQRIVVCPKFLQGQCFNKNCLLSHTKTLQKMPVCKFFLQGSCVRSDCPYLHKKLRDDSEICEDFRRGFCTLGEQCNKQHVFSKSKSTLNVTPESLHEVSFSRIKDTSTSLDAIPYRYFNGDTYVLGEAEKDTENPEESTYKTGDKHPDGDCKKDKIERDEREDNMESSNANENLGKNCKRKQLGTLPAFIPLS